MKWRWQLELDIDNAKQPSMSDKSENDIASNKKNDNNTPSVENQC